MENIKPFQDEDLLDYLKNNPVIIDEKLNDNEKKKKVDDANKVIKRLKEVSKGLGFDIYHGIGNVIDLARTKDKASLVLQLAVIEGTGYQNKGRGFVVVENGIVIEDGGVMNASIWSLARMFDGYGLSVKLIEEKTIKKVGLEKIEYKRMAIAVFDDGSLGFLGPRSEYYLALFCDQLIPFDLDKERGLRALGWELIPRKAVVEYGSKKRVSYHGKYFEEDILSRELRR